VYGSGHRRRWRQEDPLKVGSTVYNNQVIMRLPNLNTMQVIAEIHEADINKVRVDEENPQRVFITSDNRPGEIFAGHVKAIDTLAQSHWYKESVKYFLVTIDLEKQIPDLRPGTTASVELFVRQIDDVLIVPIQAVDTVRGKSYCYMAGGGERREVAIGASSHTMVEIKSGLEEGETILLEQADGASNGQEEDEEGDDSAPESPPKQATPRGGKGRRNRSN
jgi:HlyD family secretion protein